MHAVLRLNRSKHLTQSLRREGDVEPDVDDDELIADELHHQRLSAAFDSSRRRAPPVAFERCDDWRQRRVAVVDVDDITTRLGVKEVEI